MPVTRVRRASDRAGRQKIVYSILPLRRRRDLLHRILPVKLAALARGGNSLKLSSRWATKDLRRHKDERAMRERVDVVNAFPARAQTGRSVGCKSWAHAES